MLYILYTTNCISIHPGNTIVKFADDMTVVGLITRGNESVYRDEIQRLSEWCSANSPILNTTKTKEIILIFRKHKTDLATIYIIIITLLVTFYRSTINSILGYRINSVVLHLLGGRILEASQSNKDSADDHQLPLPSLTDIYTSHCLGRAEAIIGDNTHPAHHLFDHCPPAGATGPSGR